MKILNSREQEFVNNYRKNFKGNLIRNDFELFIVLTEEANDASFVEIPARDSTQGTPTTIDLPLDVFVERIQGALDAANDFSEFKEMVNHLCETWKIKI